MSEINCIINTSYSITASTFEFILFPFFVETKKKYAASLMIRVTRTPSPYGLCSLSFAFELAPKGFHQRPIDFNAFHMDFSV